MPQQVLSALRIWWCSFFAWSIQLRPTAGNFSNRFCFSLCSCLPGWQLLEVVPFQTNSQSSPQSGICRQLPDQNTTISRITSTYKVGMRYILGRLVAPQIPQNYTPFYSVSPDVADLRPASWVFLAFFCLLGRRTWCL